MAALTETRKRLGIAFAAMASLCVIAVAVLLSPLVQERSDEISQLRSQQSMKQIQVNKVGDIDQKIASASQQIAGFTKDRIPVRDSAISDNLGKIATGERCKAGVGKIFSQGLGAGRPASGRNRGQFVRSIPADRALPEFRGTQSAGIFHCGQHSTRR